MAHEVGASQKPLVGASGVGFDDATMQQTDATTSTSPTAESLSFISLPVGAGPAYEDTGFSEPMQIPPNAFGERSGMQGLGSGAFYSTQQYLAQKGLGWLFEVEESEEDSNLSLLEELDINPYEILYKIRCVLLPFKFERSILLSNPDFWGPMAVVVAYALLLIWGQLSVVSWVMTMWLIGSFLIFLLARVLGAEVTYAQSLGVIGYSLIPLVLGALLLFLFPAAHWFAILLKILVTLWAAFSAGTLLSKDKFSQKQLMLSYPILLLYIYFISLHSGV
jgi:hypothetical protein